MQTITTGGQHQGVSYFIAIDDHGGKFKARSTILFATHQAIIDWNAQGVTDLQKPSTKCRGNHFFYSNPFKQIEPATIGLIDATSELIALQDTLIATKAENATSEDVRRIGRLTTMIKEAGLMQQKMRPDTDPTDDQIEQMKAQVERLVSVFTATGIASISGNSRQTVNNWIARGRISAQAAHEVCQLPEVAAHGFTRELMRPDVKFWYI